MDLLLRSLDSSDVSSFFVLCRTFGEISVQNAAFSGRVGPSSVVLHRPYSVGGIELDSACLRVSGRSSFATVRANAAVTAGKWMFECAVLSGGLAQIGWAGLNCKFTGSEMGVGDVPLSYAYDGHRQKKWHLRSEDYGLELKRKKKKKNRVFVFFFFFC